MNAVSTPFAVNGGAISNSRKTPVDSPPKERCKKLTKKRKRDRLSQAFCDTDPVKSPEGCEKKLRKKQKRVQQSQDSDDTDYGCSDLIEDTDSGKFSIIEINYESRE